MSNENPPNPAASPARATPPSTPQPTPPKSTAPKRKVARKTTAKDDLEEARKKIREGQEQEARALAKIGEAARMVRIKTGHECAGKLIDRLDQTVREMVVTNLLSVAGAKEITIVQEWMASLVPVK